MVLAELRSTGNPIFSLLRDSNSPSFRVNSHSDYVMKPEIIWSPFHNFSLSRRESLALESLIEKLSILEDYR